MKRTKKNSKFGSRHHRAFTKIKEAMWLIDDEASEQRGEHAAQLKAINKELLTWALAALNSLRTINRD